MSELSRTQVLEALLDSWGDHKTGHIKAVEKLNVILRRGDGIAVYTNADLGSASVGHRQYVSYGSEAAQLEVAEPPEQLPDIGGQINYRYRLEGTYRGDPLPVPFPPTIGNTAIQCTTHPFTTALDNHEPARLKADGVMLRFTARDGQPAIEIPYPDEVFGKKFTENSIFLVDDGKTVVPHYISGWNNRRVGKPIWIKPFPVNPTGETRPDNGRVIDYSDMMWGPRTAFHLKVQVD